MEMSKGVVLGGCLAALAACESGDVILQPTNVDNSTDNSVVNSGGDGSDNPCASYTDPDTDSLEQGSFDGTNCTYRASFVSFENSLEVDLSIPFITGAHVFEETLAVGTEVAPGEGAAPADGEGPTLTIAPGSTLAFLDPADYLLISRGSRIEANGSPSAPITLTGFADAVTGTAGPEDVQLWGGLVINGNGITNNCTDAQRASDNCHVQSEGQPSYYGGDDNGESSGTLRYVIVKHTGFEVAPGDELNGVTFNAIGSGTVVENLEVYSTFDDGIEMFGGAVSISNLLAVYVRDDSIDFSDGWVGSVTNALVIHSQTDGNRCIEGDNIGSGRADQGVPLDTAPVTNPMISNLTCIMSSHDAGTHDPSEGIVLRRGPRAQFTDSVIFGAYADDVGENNECFEFDDDVTRNFAQGGDTTMTNSLIVCEDATKDSLQNGDDIAEWVLGANPSTNGANYDFNTGNVIVEAADLVADTDINVLDCFYTDSTLTDDVGAQIPIVPVSGQLGAVTRDDDWTAPWGYGLRAGNRGQALWFAPGNECP